jgi:bifunctional non-homologous end joining protein LigD
VSAALDTLPADLRALARPAPQPRSTEPMKAYLHDKPFSDPDWIFERKLDGVRALAFRDGDRVRMASRTSRELGPSYPELVDGLAAQPGADFVVDGEIVAFKGRRASFERLQGRMGITDPERARRTGIPVFLYLFDLLHLDGHDVTRVPLLYRKRLLRLALRWNDLVRFTPHRRGSGEEAFSEACRRGWEGLVAKRADSAYLRTRSRDWLKVKCEARQELVIGGWTPPKGARTRFGALLVGYWEDGRLRYAGKVGTGFDRRTLDALGDKLEALERDTPPFAGNDALPRAAHWAQAKLVAEIAFTEWTRDGKLRHPRFLGLRDDKRPEDVVRERPV